jgi:putative nucleotidyltransferase with HDIG domain
LRAWCGTARGPALAHSLRVATLAEALAAGYGQAHLSFDRHLVSAGALLHDVGKVRTLPAVAGAPLPPEAEQVDHITAGILLLQNAARTVDTPETRLEPLRHIVLAHHGRPEWGRRASRTQWKPGLSTWPTLPKRGCGGGRMRKGHGCPLLGSTWYSTSNAPNATRPGGRW